MTRIALFILVLGACQATWGAQHVIANELAEATVDETSGTIVAYRGESVSVTGSVAQLESAVTWALLSEGPDELVLESRLVAHALLLERTFTLAPGTEQVAVTTAVRTMDGSDATATVSDPEIAAVIQGLPLLAPDLAARWGEVASVSWSEAGAVVIATVWPPQGQASESDDPATGRDDALHEPMARAATTSGREATGLRMGSSLPAGSATNVSNGGYADGSRFDAWSGTATVTATAPVGTGAITTAQVVRTAPGDSTTEAVIVYHHSSPLGFDFDASSSTSAAGALTYAWDFGEPSSGDNTSTLEAPSHSYADDTSYDVTLIVTDENGSSDSATVTVTAVPSYAPTTPGPLSLTAADSGSVTIAWEPSVWAWVPRDYQIFRDGTLIGAVDDLVTTFTDTTVVPGTTYSYQVRARNIVWFFFPVSSPLSQALEVTVPNGLVLHYDFDGLVGSTVADISGQGNDGSLHDGAQILGAAGNHTALFDGSDDRVSVGLPASLDLATDLTMSAWVLPRNLEDNFYTYYNVLARGYYLEPDRSEGIEIFLRLADGEIHLGHWFGDYQEDIIRVPYEGNPLMHLVGVLDSQHENGDGSYGAWFLYVNGVLMATTPSTQAPASIGGEWAVGGRVPTGIAVSQVDRSFRGQIDEAKIWDVALDAAAVADLYATGASDFSPMVDGEDDFSIAALDFQLSASVIDDGVSPLTLQWQETSGLGSVLDDADTVTPTVSVPGPGTYTFEVSAEDAIQGDADTISVTVTAPAG